MANGKYHQEARGCILMRFLKKLQDVVNSPLVQNLLQRCSILRQVLTFEPGQGALKETGA